MGIPTMDTYLCLMATYLLWVWIQVSPLVPMSIPMQITIYTPFTHSFPSVVLPH